MRLRREQVASLERLEGREVVVPVEDVAVGDMVDFIGGGDRAGRRFATVSKVYPRLRIVRLRKEVKVGGKVWVLWHAAVHETRLLKNLGPYDGEGI